MRPSEPRFRGSVGLQACSGVLAGVGLLVVALKAFHDYSTYTGEEPLVGLVLFVAAALAVAGMLGVALGGMALALRKDRPRVARTLASMAFAVAVTVVVGCAVRVLG